jgi:hypothetical protein
MKKFVVIRQMRVIERASVELPEDTPHDDVIDAVEAAHEKGYKVVKRYVEDVWVE